MLLVLSFQNCHYLFWDFLIQAINTELDTIILDLLCFNLVPFLFDILLVLFQFDVQLLDLLLRSLSVCLLVCNGALITNYSPSTLGNYCLTAFDLLLGLRDLFLDLLNGLLCLLKFTLKILEPLHDLFFLLLLLQNILLQALHHGFQLFLLVLLIFLLLVKLSNMVFLLGELLIDDFELLLQLFLFLPVVLHFKFYRNIYR